jgi:hypothetical protein
MATVVLISVHSVEKSSTMKLGKTAYVLIGLVLAVGVASAVYFGRTLTAVDNKVPKPSAARTANPDPAPLQPNASPNPGDAVAANPPNNLQLPTNFLGSLTPGGTVESAGRERTYVVSYQVAFFRKTPADKVPEENLTYEELQRYPKTLAPYVFYGENVFGKNDPAHPESIAVRATLDGKETTGHIDAAKLWLEPPLDHAESDRYMAVTDTASIYVVPDSASPSVLALLQGEVVEAVGQLNLQGRNWVKARFNAFGRPRYGFIPKSDVKALTFASVNQSVVGVEEIPKGIRSSGLSLSGSDRQRLSQNGFYVEPVPPRNPIEVDDMADAYNDETSHQFFITSDLFLHSYHLIFDRMLQDIEEKKILPSVAKMSEALASTAETQLKAAPAAVPGLRDALLHDLLYFSVAAKLFNPGFAVPMPVRSQAEALVASIQSAAGELPSLANRIGFDQEDFTQYKVRGHYEKNEALKRYFRGMRWFGRRNFLLSNKTATLAAILLPSIIEEAHEARRFESVDALTTYLIGRQDKYTLAGYRSVNQKIFGTETPSFRQFAPDLDERIAAFQRTAWSDLPAPQIVSVQTGLGLTQDQRLQKTAAFKFLGQRYVLDAFILNQLTSPSVGSDSSPRNLPSALDVMMILGSKAAADVQQRVQKEQPWPNYDRQIEKLKEISQETLSKPSTFYDNWLSALKTLFLPTASKQLFALREPWQYKSLNTGLASWTELKHDTILYAEQSEAEQGEGDEFEIPPYIPPGPKGYVEPNPALFKQLTRSIDQMITEMKSADFITEEYLDKFTLFRELAHRAEVIAQKEVAGEVISNEDFGWITAIRYSFDSTLVLPRDANEITDPSSLQMALIADIATDAVNGRVLEEGIGTPQRIVVAVKDAWGGTRLTVGFVYSWYEFDSTKRWSDTEWKKPIYSGDENTRKQQGITPPAWYSTFVKNTGAS